MPDRQPDPSDLVLLGRFGEAHGLKGEIKIVTFTAIAEDIAAYGQLSTQDGARSFDLSHVRPMKDNAVIAKVAGVGDRTAAEKLRGIELYVPRARLPQAGEDEYYHSDLIGLIAKNLEGSPLGTVIAIHNFGAGDLLEIRLDGRKDSALVPFDGANVPSVDVRGGNLTIATDFKALNSDDDHE